MTKATSTIIVLLALIAQVASVSTSDAQTNNPALASSVSRPSGAPAARHSRFGAAGLMQHSLGLSDEQAKKLEPIMRQHAAKVATVRRDNTLSRQERTAKMKEIGQDTSVKLKAVLTPEQFQKLQDGRKAFQQRLQTQSPASIPKS
jgi:Spy/CpxP family protein refolding chaperone